MKKQKANVSAEEIAVKNQKTKLSKKSFFIIIGCLFEMSIAIILSVCGIFSAAEYAASNTPEVTATPIKITEYHTQILPAPTQPPQVTQPSAQTGQKTTKANASSNDNANLDKFDFEAQKKLLNDCERYITYIATNTEIIQTQINLCNISSDASYRIDLTETCAETVNYMVKIYDIIKDDPDLTLVLLSYDDIPFYDGSSEITSYARTLARRGGRLVDNYTIYCSTLGITYVDPRTKV